MPGARRIAQTIGRHGREVVLRLAPATVSGEWIAIAVTAHVMGVTASDLAAGAGIVQGDRKVTIAQAEIDLRAVPRALKPGDRIVIDGVATSVEAPADIRYLLGAPALHVVRVRGG